jgi:hypothetical protein
MSQSYDADLLDDLYDGAEGPAHTRHFDEFELGDEAEDEFADAGEDGMEEFDEFAGEDEDAVEAMTDAVTDALEEEDEDQFLRRLRRIVRRVAPIVSRVASAIPLPQAQLIGRAAGVIGRLAADEADEFEAIDELLDLVDDEGEIDAAAPIIAGLTIRRAVPNVARLPRPQRRQLVRSVVGATRQVARRHGPRAAAAIPAVVQAARRTVAQRRLPLRRLPQVIQRTAARVARSPQLVRRLARQRPTGGGGGMAPRRAGIGGGGPLCVACGRQRTYTFRGPVRLTIRPA